MSRFIEQFLDKKLHEYGRKSKTILIIYKCRHDGITKTRLQHKKKRISRNESSVKQTYKDHTNTNTRSSEIDSENGNKDILETILRTWSSSLETDMSKFFEEPQSSNSILPDETDRHRFPFQGTDTIKPVYYWNIETENIKQKLEECCDCSKKRTPRTPPLYLDAISKLRLQSFIRSLCENKCNSKLCQPEDEVDKETPIKCKQKRRKNKKNCKCKKDSSMVSFHVTVPKQTKSVILKNNPNPTKAKNDKTDKTNETNKDDDDNNKCLNCPHFNKNNKVQCAPINQKTTIVEPGDITLSLGNQTITISVKQADNGESRGESVKTNSPSPKYSRTPTEQLNERTKCAYYQNKNSSQENAQFSASCRKNLLPSNTDKKTCECLQKIKESMEEDLKKFVLSQLKFNEKPCSNPPANDHQEMVKCRLLKNKLEKLRRDRQNQNSYCRNSTSSQGQQSKKTKYSGRQDFREFEEDDDSDENPVKQWSTNKYPRCVKICLERQREDETSEEQEEECDCQNRFRSTGTGNRSLCEHEACPWKNNKNKVKYQNNQKIFPGKSSYKCPFYDGDRKPKIKNRMNKCCSCSLTIIEKEKKKCECPKSKKKPPKLQDKCCQCQPNQSKNTQFENVEHKSSVPNDTTQDSSAVNEDTVDESTDQSRRTSVEEAFVVNMESPNRNSSKAIEVQESDLEGKDESCSCCVCDKESSDDVNTPEYPCDLSSGSEEDDPPMRQESSRRRNRQSCDCEASEVASTDGMRRGTPKSPKRSRNTRKSNFNTFCGDNDERERSKRNKKSNNMAKQEITSTEDLIECECEEFEQLLAELEEYCKTKCVNFKVLQNRENSGYNVPEKKFLSISSTPKNSAFMVQNDRSNISASFHAHPNFSKKFFEKNAFVLRSQGLFRISSKKSRSKEKVRCCAPRKTSSKLSDQREDLTSTSGLEFNHYDFNDTPDEKNDTRYESSIVDEDINSSCNPHTSNPIPTELKRLTNEKTKSGKDMSKSAKGCVRNVVEKDEIYLEEINMKKSICLIPALLEEVEMMSFLSSKKHRDRTSNSFIRRASDRNFDRSFPSSLQGRTEIHPRRNRQHQIPEFSSAKNSRGKHQEKHEFFDQLHFDPNKISSHKLLKRVEKSAERIVRGITIRNLESVKRIGASNPKLIVRVFEKYLSEVLNCNAKLLLGRKNLGLMSYEDYLMESASKIQDLNLTYYMNIENPFSCLIYPSLIEGCGNKNKMSISSECGDKQNPEDNKMRCNCKLKNTCCHCKPAKTQPTNEVKKTCGCTKDGKSVDNKRGSKGISRPATNNRTSFKISDMKLGGEPMSVQKINEQELKETCKMGPTASSLTSGNGMKIKRKCDCQRKSTMQTIGEGETTVKRCGCAKKKTEGHSRGRSRSSASKSKSKKHKCDCTEPCEPKSAITAEGDHQPKKASCECVPDLKNDTDVACNPACSSHNAGPRCPCPCRALLKMKCVKEGYMSADPYGEKEDKRLCVCQPNSRIMKNMEEEPDVPPKETPCGVCGVSEGDKKNPPHKCDICELVEGLGTHPDENASMATIASSDFDQIANILRDTRNDNNLLSNIKCFRNSSGIICQSQLVGCPVSGEKGVKCKTNTIEIRIKYPNKMEKYKDMSCSAVCTNTNSSKMAGGKQAKQERYCEFVKNLQQEISACCAQPDKSDLSMLLDSFARGVSDKGERRSSCLKSTTFDDRVKGSCSFKTDNISCQTSVCEGVKNDEKDVECIFRRGEDCPPICGDDSLCSKRKSLDSLDDWAFEQDNKEIQIGECSKESCMRLVHQPVIAKKRKSEVECDVKGSCIREKIFEKLFPNEKQPCKVLSTSCEPPTRRASQDKKAPNSKASPKNKVASKSSSKNITKSQDKAASGKVKRNDTMKLDKFDQSILERALDAFLSKGK